MVRPVATRTLRSAHGGGLSAQSGGKPDTSRILQWGSYNALHPMFGWSLDDAFGALQGHATGNFSISGRLQEDMVAHAWIGHAIDKRCAVETECPTIFTVSGRTKEEQRRAQRCRDFCKEVYPHILPLHTRNTLHRHRHMMGQAIFAMDWEEVRDGRDKWWIPFIKPWDPQFTSYLYGLDPGYTTVDGGTYCATTLSNGLVRVVPGDGRWGILRNRLEKSWLSGAVYCLASEYVGDGYNFRDNQDHQDRWGRGIVTLEYPDQMPKNELAALGESLNRGGGGGVLMLPQLDAQRGVKADLLRADGAGWQTFDHTETRILRRILVRLLGSDLASVGQTGIAENDPRTTSIWQLYCSDAQAATDCAVSAEWDELTGERVRVCVPCDGPLRQQVFSWVARWNFGDPALAPYIWLDATEPEDHERQQDAVAGRAQKIGGAFASVSTAVKNKLLDADEAAWALEQCGLSKRRPGSGPGGTDRVGGGEVGQGSASAPGGQRQTPTVAEREARALRGPA